MLVCAGVVFPSSDARLRPAVGVCLALVPFSTVFFSAVSILNMLNPLLRSDFSTECHLYKAER